MNRKPLIAVLALALAGSLSACVTATPYQAGAARPATTGGYSEIKLEPNRFRVTFSGNSITSRETVETYLLFRAAEITLAQGFDTFTIAERHTDRSARTIVESDPFYRGWPDYGYWRPHWRYAGAAWDPFFNDPFWSPGAWRSRDEVRTLERFEAAAEILMTKGPKVQDDPAAFDAHAVVENLGPRVQRPVVKP